MRSDSYSALGLEAQPQGRHLWKPKARRYLLGKFPQVGRAIYSEGKQREAANLLTGFDIAQVSGAIYTAVQRTTSDRLR
eukprot:3319780-Alexandrium_andersonii.AAC.1